MTAYLAIPNADIDPESPINTSLMTALRDNPIAMFEKASGAPVLANGYVVQAMIAGAAVGQAQLKVAISYSSTATSLSILRTGGLYTLGYQMRIYNNSGNTATKYGAIDAAVDNAGSYTVRADTFQSADLGLGAYTDWEARKFISQDASGTNASGTTEYQELYIQASPPYDLGDGEIPLFVFAVVDSLGNIESVTVAPEAPWHYNGPTDIRADQYKNGKGYRKVRAIHAEMSGRQISELAKTDPKMVANRLRTDPIVELEVTQAIKNADMSLIPHPFMRNDLAGKSVIMLDPVCDLTWELAALHNAGDSVDRLLRSGAVLISNEPLNRAGPPGVMIVAPRWK